MDNTPLENAHIPDSYFVDIATELWDVPFYLGRASNQVFFLFFRPVLAVPFSSPLLYFISISLFVLFNR